MIYLKMFLLESTSVAWSPDGAMLAATYGGQGSGLRVWDTATGELISTAQRGDQQSLKVVWRPDGLVLARTALSSGVSLYDPNSGDWLGAGPISADNFDWNSTGDLVVGVISNQSKGNSSGFYWGYGRASRSLDVDSSQ